MLSWLVSLVSLDSFNLNYSWTPNRDWCDLFDRVGTGINTNQSLHHLQYSTVISVKPHRAPGKVPVLSKNRYDIHTHIAFQRRTFQCTYCSVSNRVGYLTGGPLLKPWKPDMSVHIMPVESALDVVGTLMGCKKQEMGTRTLLQSCVLTKKNPSVFLSLRSSKPERTPELSSSGRIKLTSTHWITLGPQSRVTNAHCWIPISEHTATAGIHLIH